MKKGFTLLEILLVIAAIGILAAIVIIAINPNRQLAQARDTQRRSDTNTISKALDQYLIDNGSYPVGVTGSPQEVCATGSNGVGQGSVNSGCTDLRPLVPTYLAAVPVDPSGTGSETGYEVWENAANGKAAINASGAEIQPVSLNPDIIREDLVFYVDAGASTSYPGTGSTWSDLSGNGYDLTLTNGPTWNSDGYFSNDADSYFTGAGGVEIPQGADPYSIGVWARQTSIWAPNGGGGLISVGGFDESYESNVIRTEGSLGDFRHYWWNLDITGSDNSIALGEWFYVVGQWDGTTTRTLWINGQEVSSDIPWTPINVTETTIQVSAGSITGGFNEYQQGDVAAAFVYDRPLTAEEIEQNYQVFQARYGQ